MILSPFVLAERWGTRDILTLDGRRHLPFRLLPADS